MTSQGTDLSDSEVLRLGKEVESTIVSSLQDPDRPRHCARFYVACFDVLCEYDPFSSTRRWSRRHSALLDALMKYLSHPNVSIFELADREYCQCDLSKPLEQRMHRTGADPTLQRWEWPMSVVGYAIVVFASASPSRLRSIQSSRHPTWPSSTAQLIPYGLQATLDSLIGKIDAYIPSVCCAIHGITVAFGRPKMTRMLVDHVSLPMLLHNFLSYWETSASRNPLNNYWTQARVIRDVANATHTTLRLMVDLFSSPPDALRRFVERSGAPHDNFVVLMSSLVHFGTRAKAIAPDNVGDSPSPTERIMYAQLDAVLSAYRSMGATLHSILELPVYHSERYHPSMQQPPIPPRWISLSSRLHAIQSQAEENPSCFGPQCEETETTAMRKFYLCGGCEHMTYCSKECQRRAWKHEREPHKCVRFPSLYPSLSSVIGYLSCRPICKLIRQIEAKGISAPVWAERNFMRGISSVYSDLLRLSEHIDQLA
ncbi:hypothetical protein PUNSTDRAFT_132310 [Punctularia strigosozonata HHB-11173 SS5]|uniref:uncharacterized protein n=1 Tax=Punctularia strigosozonata (strain HHB-11173) TaxID=741275 RepID=UPI0004416D6D|nr:uncharacterized protein PUNSTDRAFT_132310 [Punctularia strigosozonata HHB-11173 SS5]EIN10213.1 hypothetical protein PUNSTDRAFT_132310 [Punctularia strigosozonata HHB-11173 SS5]